MDIFTILSLLVLLLFLIFQLRSYLRAKEQMKVYREIYPDKTHSLSVDLDEEDPALSRIIIRSSAEESPNEYYRKIVARINSHIRSSGGQLDFDFVEGVMDETCDPLEHQIRSLSSQPVYLGLMGTLAGVIIGILGLMLGGEFEDGEIRRLLEGVAVAMSTSIAGLIMLLAAGSAFGRVKHEHARRRADFLDWVQGKLVPALPRDTATVVNHLVQNLVSFNDTFSSSVEKLSDSLADITESRQSQLEVIRKTDDLLKRVALLDMAQMAAANIEVMKKLDESVSRLEESSTRIEHFNEYLARVDSYVRQLTDFQTQLNSHTESLADAYKVLKEMYDFFSNYKGSIGNTVADADRVLDQALEKLRETAAQQVGALSRNLGEESERFVDLLKSYEEQLLKARQSIADAFEARVSEVIPLFRERLDQVPEIESAVGTLVDRGKRLDAGVETISRDLSEVASSVGSLTDTGKRLDDGVSTISRDLSEVASSVGSLTDTGKRLDAGVDALSHELTEVGHKVEVIDGSIGKLSERVRSATPQRPEVRRPNTTSQPAPPRPAGSSVTASANRTSGASTAKPGSISSTPPEEHPSGGEKGKPSFISRLFRRRPKEK